MYCILLSEALKLDKISSLKTELNSDILVSDTSVHLCSNVQKHKMSRDFVEQLFKRSLSNYDSYSSVKTALLQVCNWYTNPQSACVNGFLRFLFAAEDPSENYVKLRDYVLVKLCQSLPPFAADKLPLGFSADMIKEAQEKLKINKVCKTSPTKSRLILWISFQIISNITKGEK